jgi:hypothetical protein
MDFASCRPNQLYQYFEAVRGQLRRSQESLDRSQIKDREPWKSSLAWLCAATTPPDARCEISLRYETPPDVNVLLLVKKGIEGLNLHFVSVENFHYISTMAVMCASFWLEAGGYDELIVKLRGGGINVQDQWLRMLKFQVRRVEYSCRTKRQGKRQVKLGRLEKRLLSSVLQEAKREDESDILCACFGRGFNGHHREYAFLKDPEGPFLENGSLFMYCFSPHSMETF